MTTPHRTRPAATARDRSADVSAAHSERRSWSAPRLRTLGELRGLTFGPSPGVGETGNPALFRA